MHRVKNKEINHVWRFSVLHLNFAQQTQNTLLNNIDFDVLI